ncbi:hypothetical protein RUM43_009758 [Polyplax serrata]|uniref:Uncharacterized protein n=1 Tax=Polyplax serrata TaxID=468196 RepID=A0AAN8PUU2_POLSC
MQRKKIESKGISLLEVTRLLRRKTSKRQVANGQRRGVAAEKVWGKMKTTFPGNKRTRERAASCVRKTEDERSILG